MKWVTAGFQEDGFITWNYIDEKGEILGSVTKTETGFAKWFCAFSPEDQGEVVTIDEAKKIIEYINIKRIYPE